MDDEFRAQLLGNKIEVFIRQVLLKLYVEHCAVALHSKGSINTEESAPKSSNFYVHEASSLMRIELCPFSYAYSQNRLPFDTLAYTNPMLYFAYSGGAAAVGYHELVEALRVKYVFNKKMNNLGKKRSFDCIETVLQWCERTNAPERETHIASFSDRQEPLLYQRLAKWLGYEDHRHQYFYVSGHTIRVDGFS